MAFVKETSPAQAPTLDLHEIQATVLRLRPAPYFGAHVLLRVDDARAGRELLRRLTPHVDSAASWWNKASPWLSVAISYAGLQALGVPSDSLQSFPEAFRVGMAARARQLGDEGVNDPKHWHPPFGTGEIHIGLSAFSDSEEKRRRILAFAREQYERISESICCSSRTSARSRATSTPWVTRTESTSRRSRAAASSRCLAKGLGSRPASSSSDIQARPAFRCRCRSRTSSVATGLLWVCASISRAWARSIDSSGRMEAARKNGNCSPQSWSAVGAAALL